MSVPHGFKAKANRIAIGLRRQMGLQDIAPLNLEDLASKLGFPVVPVTEFLGACPKAVAQIVVRDPTAFSAMLLPVEIGRVILVNDKHSFGRKNSSLAHEIAHALLAHPPSQVFSQPGCRNFNRDMEDEASCLSDYILIPNQAASHIVWSNSDPEAACEEYGVSRKMLNYRLNVSGARIRRERWQRQRANG